jgi:hypothetical protein
VEVAIVCLSYRKIDNEWGIKSGNGNEINEIFLRQMPFDFLYIFDKDQFGMYLWM